MGSSSEHDLSGGADGSEFALMWMLRDECDVTHSTTDTVSTELNRLVATWLGRRADTGRVVVQ